MNRSKRISAYTPSNMDPALLKRIFVQRERLLDLIVNRMTASMTSGDKHHLLLVGPRGSGKTHLVSLAVWGLKQDQRLADLMRIAWLGEDDVFSSLLHFAFAVARALADEYPDEFPADYKSKIRNLPHDDAALVVLHDVIASLKHRHLLLITENLDQTFNSLGDSGQKKLRAFLQETRRIATLSTTQQLFAGVSSRHEAFFGFFDTHHLEPLTAENAHQLIRKIAVEQQKLDLLRFLDSDQARYRIRALHHLAGGNYRMYVLLAEFLSRETLDDLVEAFETLAEEMTPYFQERMRSLPDQQRQLAQALCDATGALTVKEISQETFIAEGNCSKQLANLKTKGYVRSEKRGKESYYDMAEPLMRLCLEVKNQRGRPLKLLTRFLKAWFPENQLKSWLTKGGIDSRSEQYCRAALQCDGSFEAIINSKLMVEFSEHFNAGNYSAAKNLANELTVAEPSAGLLLAAFASCMQFDFQSAAESYTRVLEIPDAPAEQKARALIGRAVTYWQLKNWHESIRDMEAAIDMPGASEELKTGALFSVFEPMTAVCSLAEVVEAIKRAFELGNRSSESYGGTPGDFVSMILQRGPTEWADYVSAIVPLYIQNGVADKLGQGLTQTIQRLDEGGFSKSQLDLWNGAWQNAGKDCEALEIPLACLDAAIEVLKSEPPTDRPLFRLPLEVRQLIRPLLKQTLSEN